MKMGSGNRGQLRPHFGSRSPPFIVAALCVGLGILGISYYSLSNQYASIESQLVTAVHKYESIDQEADDLRKQLESKSEDFDRVKVILEKKELNLIELRKQVTEKDSAFRDLSSKLKTLETEVAENKKKLDQGSEMQNTLEALKKSSDDKEKKLEQEIEQLKKSNDELRAQVTKNGQGLSLNVPTSNVINDKAIEDVPIKDPSYRSKLNADTDVEAGGIKPQIPAEKDDNSIVNVSPKMNKTKVVSGEDNNVVDTNNSKEVQDDEFPFPNKTHEDEISKGNDQETNHINNLV